jgi:DNA invertase Pin-like site-specific DNA recombinase
MRAAIYLRVSTSQQRTTNQRRELEHVARQRGWEIVGVYEDTGISGAKGRDQRPEFDRLLKDAARVKFDIIAAWSVDRLGRSLQDLVAFLSELKATGRDLYLHTQGLDTTTPSGRAMFGMLSVFSEFERAMIVERVNAGLARAAASGIKLGRGNRKDGRRSVDEKRWGMSSEALEDRIHELRKEGMGVLKIGRTLGVGTSKVQRVLGIRPSA